MAKPWEKNIKKGVHIALGPVIGPMGLKAAAGRNWESFGADPYLQGIGAATVEGLQDEGGSHSKTFSRK